jgi:hypothetical protein
MSRIANLFGRTCRRRGRGFAVAAFALIAGLGPAAATDWVERPFVPRIGSRWTIETEETTERQADGATTRDTEKKTAQLVFIGKTKDGFRVTYHRTGSSDEQPVYRVATDASGKPIRVENLDEMRAALRKAVERAAASGDPRNAAAIQQLFDDFAKLDAAGAARENLDVLPVLALGQNTGLKIGETRSETPTNLFPGGGQYQENRSLTIAHADTESGNVTFLLTEAADPGSLRSALIGMMEKLGETNPEGKRQAEALKELQISQESRTEIDVVGGMTRQLRVETTTSESLHGNSTLTISHKTVLVNAAK